MNSTLKSLLFWIVLVIVGVLIWNFSTNFQTRDQPLPFSKFLASVEKNEVQSVKIVGNNISGTTKQGVKFRTYAPAQFEGLGNLLHQKDVEVEADEPAVSTPE